MEVRCLSHRKYISNFLACGVRTDGRVPDATRPVSISVGSISSADGSALVRYGDTVVICGVKLELVASPDSNRIGYLVCNVECGSCCLPESSSGAPSSQVQALTKQLQLLMDKYVMLKQLTIENCEFVWTVFVDIVCLSHHGNLLDTCTLAAIAALQDTKTPTLSMDLNYPKIDISSTTALPLMRPSFTVSFALLDGWCLLDPTLAEERNAQGHLSCNIRNDGAMTQFQHSGHKITEQEMLRLSQLAMSRVSSLNKLLLTSQQHCQNIGI